MPQNAANFGIGTLVLQMLALFLQPNSGSTANLEKF